MSTTNAGIRLVDANTNEYTRVVSSKQYSTNVLGDGLLDSQGMLDAGFALSKMFLSGMQPKSIDNTIGYKVFTEYEPEFMSYKYLYDDDYTVTIHSNAGKPLKLVDTDNGWTVGLAPNEDGGLNIINDAGDLAGIGFTKMYSINQSNPLKGYILETYNESLVNTLGIYSENSNSQILFSSVSSDGLTFYSMYLANDGQLYLPSQPTSFDLEAAVPLGYIQDTFQALPNEDDITVDTTTARTLVAADNGTQIFCDNSGATTVTVPGTLDVGFICYIHQIGTGLVTISSSDNLNGGSADIDLAGQWDVVKLVQYSEGNWMVA